MSEPKPLLKPVAPATVEPRLWTGGRFIEDEWRVLADAEPVPAGGHVLLTLARFRAEHAALAADRIPVGVVVDPAKADELSGSDVASAAVIALDFPKFTDGRAYSVARRLRDRHGFRGQIRATGDVLLDQLPLMLRAGFDAAVVRDAATVAALERGALPESTLAYQTGSEGASGPWRLRRAAR